MPLFWDPVKTLNRSPFNTIFHNLFIIIFPLFLPSVLSENTIYYRCGIKFQTQISFRENQLMSIIQQIREKAAWLVFGVIVLSLIGFIFMDARTTRLFSGSRSTTVGTINGEKIEFEDFQRQISSAEEQAKMRGYPMNEAIQQNIKETVWKQLVEDALLGKNYARPLPPRSTSCEPCIKQVPKRMQTITGTMPPAGSSKSPFPRSSSSGSGKNIPPFWQTALTSPNG